MKYRIGLDIGISSCGWAVINLDQERIEDLGVRIFDKAETGDGEPLAKPRRDARGARRRNRRKRHRIERIRELIVRSDLLTRTEMDHLYNDCFELDVWELRVDALQRKLSKKEWARVLIHLAQRRGFKSNRKSEESKKENGPLLSNINENRRIMDENGYQTIAELMVNHEKFKNHKRNKAGSYLSVVSRQDVHQEIVTLFESQRVHQNPWATSEFEEAYLEIWSSQRPYASKEQIEKMIGFCTLEEGEKRAPKASISFQKFMALQKINHLRFVGVDGGRMLTHEERNYILQIAFTKKTVKYHDIRKQLQLDDQIRFRDLYYEASKSVQEVEKAKFLELTDYHRLYSTLKKLVGKNLSDEVNDLDWDTFAYALTIFKDDQDIRDYLKNEYKDSKGRHQANLANQVYPDEWIDELIKLSFSKVGHLSFVAIRKVLPYLEQGYTYDKACELAGYQFQGNASSVKKRLLPAIPLIGNPVVQRALSQTRKVINAIIKRYGSPVSIHIETSRELPKRFDERKKIQKEHEENRKMNETARKRLKELGINDPRGQDIVKYKLWQQQNGWCMYSNKYIEPNILCEIGCTEVDHILPFSRSLDDSYNNKVLVLARENQNKGSKTPFEYLGGDESKWNEFVKRVENNSKINKVKKRNLLRKHFNEREQQEFRERNLIDTQYISRFMSNFIRQNLLFADDPIKKKVVTVNGKVTAHLRSRWGFNKNRAESDLHHAVDAVIVGVTSDHMIQLVNRYYQQCEEDKFYIKRNKIDFPEPWHNFRLELEARISQSPQMSIKSLNHGNYDEEMIKKVRPIFVSRMPRRSVTGEAHQKTIRKFVGYSENGLILTAIKTPLTKITLDKNGEFPMYGKESDPATYQAIKARLLEFNNDPKKAFEKPLHKPTKSGKLGPVIKSVKILDKQRVVRPINQKRGVVYNSKIIRTDVFFKDGKYYLIPIYTIDTTKDGLPNKAITAGKPYAEWVEIDDTFEFRFSLFPNDLVRVVPRINVKVKEIATGAKTKLKEFIGYYKSVDISTAGIYLISHDRVYESEKIGSKTLVEFEKYQVDILGNYTKVKGEKRLGLATRHDHQ
ncbi:type II CRISPR RNA-guided endonuclease Cas9 [Thermoflavimicrobium daqui]|uniref:CRISPR-associated endonuclease Cas9 n=1 Tax=Thermoflavimicrobium daqui TaxID=2137476 RepID=A0A364K8W4_9BACL|nr:type II CRISPR RNA-guided endonuclease Cas9 [Thermoflavimicrobium daqui]RAL26737.1 type II CRISPR RNA-guided endonuclease Cas9 [Thermoflavimicrobium daqui]